MSINIGTLSNATIVEVITQSGLHYLNTAIIPHDAPDGRWTVHSISNETARELAIYAGHMDGDGSGRGTVSHIGHQGTSDAIAALWGYRVPVDRTPWHGEGLGLALQLRGRIPEGSILTKEQMDQIGYDWRVIYHESATAPDSAAEAGMLVKIQRQGSSVERITNPANAAALMAQHPGERFTLLPYDLGTNPYAAVMEVLHEVHDCSMVNHRDFVAAHPRSADSRGEVGNA